MNHMKTKTQWEGAVDIYNDGMGTDGDKLNSQVIYPALTKLLGSLEGKKILDSGCGSGYFTAKIAAHAREVIGTDFSEKFITLCKHKYITVSNMTFEQQDVTEKMPFGNGTFDTIISKMVLQYVADLTIFAAESFRVLRTNGRLVIAVDHPFHAQFYFAQKLAGAGTTKYKKLSHYFDRGEQLKRSLWGKADLTWYPKTVADYITPFLAVGFTLHAIEELGEERKDVSIPRILILDFIRK